MDQFAAWQLRVSVGARRRCRLALINQKPTDQRGSVLVSEGGQKILSLDTPFQGGGGTRIAHVDGMRTRRPPRLNAGCYLGLQQYLLTVCTFRRIARFRDVALTAIGVRQFLRTADRYAFDAIAYCFMPDHMHALVEGIRDDSDFLRFVAMFKQRAAFHVKAESGLVLWQDGFHDHVLRSEDETLSVAAYVVQNPVRAGLCADPREYPFLGSSRYSIEALVDVVAWRPERAGLRR